MPLADYPTGAMIDEKFGTQGLDGASITMAGDGALRIYKGNSVTQRTSASGITFTEDFDGVTGVHHLRIDLSDNTDAGFYAAGSSYQVVLIGASVDGKTVSTPLYSFSIEIPGGTLALTKSATFGLSALQALVVDKTGYRLSATGVNDILRTTLTEAYAADGAEGTLTQLLYFIQQSIGEFSIAGTTITIKKLDGASTAATITMNSPTTPTARTRAT